MIEYSSELEDDSKVLTAVLLLPSKPDWYWRKLAQVPFLLRNALTLQRAGIKKLVIWMQDPDENAEARKLEQDPRLTLQVKWSTNCDELRNTRVIVIDGSTLLEKSELIKAMTPSSERRIDFSNFLFFPSALQQMLVSQEKILMHVIPPHKSSRLLNEEDFHTSEEKLLNSVGLSNDSLMDRLVTRFISRQLTPLFLKTGLTPNQISFLSLLIGLGSAWSFFQGTYTSGLIGSLMLLVSAWVDCIDGEIARLKFMETKVGARFDIYCDNIVHFFVFFSIGMGLFFQTGDPLHKLYGGLAVYGSLVSFMILNGVIVQKKQASGQVEKLEVDFSDQLANRDFIYLLLVMACIGRLDIFILLTAIGANLFAIYLMYQKWGR